jgi:L-fucose mutarotase
MLKNVPKIISPELLKVLCEMGHGDEIVIGDANFPAETNGKRVVRADGLKGPELLEAILQLIPLDTYSQENILLMQTTNGDPTPEIWAVYKQRAEKQDPNVRIGFLERNEFYNRSRNAYAVVASGEEAIYANIIIKKGVIK